MTRRERHGALDRSGMGGAVCGKDQEKRTAREKDPAMAGHQIFTPGGQEHLWAGGLHVYPVWGFTLADSNLYRHLRTMSIEHIGSFRDDVATSLGSGGACGSWGTRALLSLAPAFPPGGSPGHLAAAVDVGGGRGARATRGSAGSEPVRGGRTRLRAARSGGLHQGGHLGRSCRQPDRQPRATARPRLRAAGGGVRLGRGAGPKPPAPGAVGSSGTGRQPCDTSGESRSRRPGPSPSRWDRRRPVRYSA